MLLLNQALEEVSELLIGLLQQAGIGIAQIDRQDRPFRDHVHEIGVKLDAADRPLLLAAHALRETAHEHRDLAGGAGCIAPQIHWRGAGVGGATGNRDLRPGEPGDPFDGADNEMFVLEDRPLFDVQFEVRVRREKARACVAGIADAPQLLADRRTVDAAHSVGLLECKAADIDQASHRIGWKARSLFIGEGDERQRPPRGLVRAVKRLACLEARQHAVKAVIAAAGPHRVDVRAEHDRRQLLAAGTRADDVADGIDAHPQADLAHPPHEQIAAGAVFLAEREPAVAAAGQGADAVECIEPAEQSLEVDPRRCPHPRSAAHSRAGCWSSLSWIT